MASFELIGYIKNITHIGGRARLTIGEYVQGKRNDDGEIENEKMDLWFVFFPKSSNRHLTNFKPNDLVIVKGTIHQSLPNTNYTYAINAESIKHFYTRNLLDELKMENSSKKSISDGDKPNLDDFLKEDF